MDMRVSVMLPPTPLNSQWPQSTPWHRCGEHRSGREVESKPHLEGIHPVLGWLESETAAPSPHHSCLLSLQSLVFPAAGVGF